MFFSIVIPLYNRPQEIKELLDTLTRQTYTRFEVLVIEDGSSIPSGDIVQSFADKLDIKYFTKANSGQGPSRNFGFERAAGDYFIVFDSDCLIPANYLEIVAHSLEHNYLDAFGGPDAAHPSFTAVQKAISYSMTSPFTTGGIRGNKKSVGQFHPRSFNMGISRKVWEATGGFKLTRLSEDIEYSLRMYGMGFKVGLIPDAKVYHKRRTSFSQFYKQLHSFGRGRIIIYKLYPSSLKPVHFFPTVFALGVIFSLLANVFKWPIATLCNILLTVYILLIFFHALVKNKSLKVALLSIVASFIQLIAYGFGFIQEFWTRIILNNNN